MNRICVIAICCVVAAGCGNSVDRAARRAYELTLPVAADGSGWWSQRDGTGRVATWQIRLQRPWDDYVAWVRPRLMSDFDSVVSIESKRLLCSKALDGDQYTLDIRMADTSQVGYATATFTARPD